MSRTRPARVRVIWHQDSPSLAPAVLRGGVRRHDHGRTLSGARPRERHVSERRPGHQEAGSRVRLPVPSRSPGDGGLEPLRTSAGPFCIRTWRIRPCSVGLSRPMGSSISGPCPGSAGLCRNSPGIARPRVSSIFACSTPRGANTGTDRATSRGFIIWRSGERKSTNARKPWIKPLDLVVVLSPTSGSLSLHGRSPGMGTIWSGLSTPGPALPEVSRSDPRAGPRARRGTPPGSPLSEKGPGRRSPAG